MDSRPNGKHSQLGPTRVKPPRALDALPTLPDEPADHHRDEAELVAQECLDAEVHSRTERRGDGAVDLLERSRNRLLADRARHAGSLTGAPGSIELQNSGRRELQLLGRSRACRPRTGWWPRPNLWESSRTQSEMGSKGSKRYSWVSQLSFSAAPFAAFDSCRYH